MFLTTISDDEASGRTAEIYAAEREAMGFVMAATRCWTTRPDLLPLYEDFFEGVKANFSLPKRDWRLITLIAAKNVPSKYCSIVYGGQLVDDLGSAKQVIAVQRDFRSAGLSRRDVVMLSYAETIAQNASRIGQQDIDELRSVGFTDQQISDIALCAALRCFAARFFDATGAGPEAFFLERSPEITEAFTASLNRP